MQDKITQLDGNETCSSFSDTDSSSDIGSSFSDTDFSQDTDSSFDTDSSCDNHCSSGTDSSFFEDDKGSKISVIVNIFSESMHNHPPPVWYDPPHKSNKYRKPVRVTIRRDNRLGQSTFLPIIAVSNLRSLMPKIENFVQDMSERDVGLALLSEIWEKPGRKKHKFKVDKMLHMDGFKYISTPRPTRRGGGAAIMAPVAKFSLEKIDVSIPHNLEVCWGLLRPKTDEKTDIKEIIAVSFYSPPKSRKKTKLLDHLMTTL